MSKDLLIENEKFPKEKTVTGDNNSFTMINVEVGGFLTLNGQFKVVKIDKVETSLLAIGAEIEELYINQLSCGEIIFYNSPKKIIIDNTTCTFLLESKRELEYLSLNNFRTKNFIVEKPIKKLLVNETLITKNFECKAKIQELDAKNFKILGKFNEQQTLPVTSNAERARVMQSLSVKSGTERFSNKQSTTPLKSNTEIFSNTPVFSKFNATVGKYSNEKPTVLNLTDFEILEYLEKEGKMTDQPKND